MAGPLCDMMQPVGIKVIETLHPGGTERMTVAPGTMMDTIPMTLPVAQPGLASGESYCSNMTGMFSSSFIQTSSYQRWRNIGGTHQLCSDEEIACFLMNCYEENLSRTSPVKGRCINCGSPLMLSCSNCGRHLGSSTVPICLGNTESGSEERPRLDQGSQKGRQVAQRGDAKKGSHVQEKALDDHKEFTLLVDTPQSGNQQRPAPPHHLQTWANASHCYQLQAQPYPSPQEQVPYTTASPKQEEDRGGLWCSEGQQLSPNSEGEELQDFGVRDADQSLLNSRQTSFAQQHQELEQESEQTEQQQQQQTLRQTQSCSFDASPSAEDKVKEEPSETKQENPPEKDKCRKGKRSKTGKDLYCQPCNKQLSSRQAFDRHISSKLHAISLLPPELQAKRRRRKKAVNPQQSNQDKSVYVVVKMEGKQEYQCKVCSQGFSTVQEVKQHRRQHKEREMCHLCGKTVNVRGFHDHMLRHRGERRHHCPLCPKTFINAALLKDHAIVHTEDKPYCCEVCGACFRHRHTLKFHLRTHLGIKAYRCSQCDASFTRPRGLSDHMRVHTGEKPYGCQVCGRYFSSSGNLAAHRRKVHKMAPLRPNVPCRLLIT